MNLPLASDIHINSSQSSCSLIFIGSGSLLIHAVTHVIFSGAIIRFIACPPGDSSISRLQSLGLSFIETNNPSVDLIEHNITREEIIFSINNKYILNDNFLSIGAKVFNIHNGLIQYYRGVGEVCVFAAMCLNEKKYGVTLHQLLPAQPVDSGPVLDQLSFPIHQDDDFLKVMKKSIMSCKSIFENNLNNIINNKYTLINPDILGPVYSYNELSILCRNCTSDNLVRAKNLGAFGYFLPRLKKFVDELI